MQAAATTTSASRGSIAVIGDHVGTTPRRSSSRSIRSAMFSTIRMWTHEWSDITSRSAFTCCTCHHALQLRIRIGRREELLEPAVAARRRVDPHRLDRLARRAGHRQCRMTARIAHAAQRITEQRIYLPFTLAQLPG